MMDFYRIEDYDANGPYRYEAYSRAGEWDKDKHPSPYDDGICEIFADPESAYRPIEKDEIFGFRSMTELRAWFDDEQLNEFITHEISVPWAFRITHYSADPEYVRHGGKQCVANRNHITYVETIDIKELLTNG